MIFRRFLEGSTGQGWRIKEHTMMPDETGELVIIATLSEEEAYQVFKTSKWQGLDVDRSSVFWKPPKMLP